jgi:hypothetical protein
MTDTAADLDIRSMPEYGDAMRTFQIEKGEAEAKGDQLGVLQAESKLHQTFSTLKDRRFAAIQASNALQTARAAAAAKHPQVKPEAYAHIQNPAEIDAYVANLQQMIDSASGGSPAGSREAPIQQQEAPSWGGGPSTTAATGAPPNDSEWYTISDPKEREQARIRHMDKLAPTVLAKGRNAMSENAELRQVAASPIISRVLANAAQRDGFDYETGEKL